MNPEKLVELAAWKVRWVLSVAVWWLWLKVTPDHPFKRDIVDAVAALGPKYRAHAQGSKT